MPVQSKPLLAAASGYPQLVSALTKPVYAAGFLKRFNRMTVSGLITSQDIVPKEIRNKGDEIIFRRAPEAEVFEYIKNMELEVSTFDTSIITMNVNRALYTNIKLDKLDSRSIDELPALLKEYQADVTQKLAERIDTEVLTEVPLAAAACNRGRKAGRRSHAFDFGAAGAPVVLTKDNIVRYLSQMRTVLSEQNVDTNGLYVVLPVEAMDLFFANPILTNACAAGTSQSIILGTKIPNVLGFEIIFSNNMPQRNEGGRIAYTIFAGRKDATGFVMQVTENEHIEKVANHFGQFWRTLQVYDFKVLYPEAITTLYATLDFAA
jgi:predicted Zn-dependent protease with MMP-like domain